MGQALPTVSLSGSVSLSYKWDGTNTENAGIAARIAMPILDASAAKYQIDAAKQQTEIYFLQKKQLSATIAVDIQDAYETMLIQMKKLDLAKLSAETMEAQLNLTKTQRDLGTATNQDYMTASVNAANAEVALETARINAQLSILQLQNIMGY
jgi:outer membrane protein TolC